MAGGGAAAVVAQCAGRLELTTAAPAGKGLQLAEVPEVAGKAASPAPSLPYGSKPGHTATAGCLPIQPRPVHRHH